MSYNYNTDNGATDSLIPYIIFSANPVQSDNTTDLGISGSIDAASYNYETDSYDPDEEKRPLPYVVYSPGLDIMDRIDAAAASLRLGMDNNETQIIEIGSSGVTTTIYGGVTIVHAINASSLALANALNVSGKTTLTNVSTQALTATTLDVTSLSATSLNVTGTIKTNIVDFGYSSNPILPITSAGYSVKYTFGSANLTAPNEYTLGSFTNNPIGIYLLTVGPTTMFGLTTSERLDILFVSTTGTESLTTFNGLEFGGNIAEKLGICFSMPFKITNPTNQLTVVVKGYNGDFSTTGGASSITRMT